MADSEEPFLYYSLKEHPLRFSGISGVQCEEFIHIVRQRALAAGKQRDNDWIIDFVTPCFIGDALRFHATLDDDVQDNWRLLQRALLQKYPAPEERVVDYRRFSPANPTIPSPASAPRQGLIRVHIEGSQLLYYVSRARSSNWTGCYMTTTSTTEALRVELVQSGVDLSKLKIVGHADVFDWLGITWHPTKPGFGTTTKDYGYLVGIKDGDSSNSAGTSLSGPTRKPIWSIGPSPDYVLTPIWKDDADKSWKLDVTVNKSGRAIELVSSIKGFHSTYSTNNWDAATLSFELA
ncbi:hypothetical protein FRB99_006669 [Tulasnella sp. 403]|nr:hypothetical protein FRB99_006669 [Tulasnella sp. 403]